MLAGWASLALAVLFGWLLPFAAVRMLVPALEAGGRTVRNYQGRRVVLGLGLAWLVWSLGMLVVQTALEVAWNLGQGQGSGGLVEALVSTPVTLWLYAAPFMLVAGTVALGLADDAFGAGGPKGFRGHLGALRAGRLTTGMLKMLGIGALGVFYGATAAGGVMERTVIGGTTLTGAWWFAACWAASALAIALSANLLNLLDLRPGRALKVFCVAIVGPALALAVLVVGSYNDSVASFSGDATMAFGTRETLLAAAALIACLLGPVAAVWRFDLGERAMLGDAGSNVLGVILGYVLTAVLPLQWLTAIVVVLLALNVSSERVSFSTVIERTPPLRAFDRLGRHAERTPQKSEDGEAPDRSPVRYHSDERSHEEED